MKIKKILAVIVSLGIVVGATVGGIYGYQAYQDKNTVVDVISVSDINWGYYDSGETSYGMVTNDSAQEIFLEGNNQVEEVYVQVGDEVTIGEPLFKYDTRQVEIDIRRKTLEISTLDNDLAIAQHELAELRKKTPVDAEGDEKTAAYLEARIDQIEASIDKLEAQPQKDPRDANIYNYITNTVVPYNYSTSAGTQADPYIICCNQGAYVYGSFFNKLRNEWRGKYVKFVVVKKNSSGKMLTTVKDIVDSSEAGDSETGDQKPNVGTDSETPTLPDRPVPDRPVITPSHGEQRDGALTYEVTKEPRYSSASATKKVTVPVADSSVSPNTVTYSSNNCPVPANSGEMWYVFSGVKITAELDRLKAELAVVEKRQEQNEGAYTKTELAAAIAEKEDEVKKLNINRQQQELQLQSLESAAANGIVYATVVGHVKTLNEANDQDNESGRHGAFMVVTSDDGLYVSGSVSELKLDTVMPGTMVTANSWESGQSFEAVITKISEYPTQNNGWGEGNPNVSYYQYTAYIQDSLELTNGEYVDLTIGGRSGENGELMEEEESSDSLYIEKAYVRQEDGKSYCMIAGEDGRLKKQYVLTGKTVWGNSVEIKAGLSEEDRIAFPYGKNVKEGVLVSDEAE